MATLRRILIGLGLAAVAAPPVAMAVFVANPDLDPNLTQFAAHFWIVSGTALAAAVACVLVIASARTLRETRLLFLALAFVSISGIFAVHGLMTPGFFADEFYSSVGASAWISIAAGAIFVALSAVDLPDPLDRAVRRGGGVIFAWTTLVVGAYIIMSFSHENWLDFIPSDDRRIQYVLGIASISLFAFGAWRYAQAYLFARLPSQAAIVVALVLLMEVPVMMLWGTLWHLSWWMYHAAYAGAFAVLFASWAIEVRRAGSLNAIADALSMRDALAQLNRGREKHLLELLDAIEVKDAATLGHVSRVAAYALRIGRGLGLGATELRALVLAAQMHDVGKIGVPDAILLKPGPLTAAEFAEIKRHTTRGAGIAGRVRALQELAPVIRAHHERLNGRGYPDGLAGDEIPLLARIIGVADSYDAMTSTRPYRAALSHDDAVAELHRVSGVELDERCVEAFLASFGQERLQAAA
jgi:HD-GYP domain-containing protein (c-di-GMP phosphodiesterase class II)